MRCLWSLALAALAMGPVAAVPVEGVTVINNRDYTPAVMTLFASAESSIVMTAFQARFYEDYPGSDSNNLCDALVAAAQRGVSVTFLIDTEDSDWNGNNAQNEDFARRLAEGGCAVYYDNADHVSHTKLIVVDGLASVISSVNWSHYALTSNNECAVIVWGPAIAAEGLAYVREQAAAGRLQTPERPMPDVPVPVDHLSEAITGYAEARGFEVLPCEDAELMVNAAYYPMLEPLLDAAVGRIDVVQMDATFYRMRPAHADPPAEGQTSISQTNELLTDLADAAARGVEVHLTLDGGRADEETGEVDNRNLDFALRARSQGVHVWWDSPQATTHAKFLVIDDNLSIVGSTNWTLFGVEGQNNEMSVLMRSPEVASRMRDFVHAIQASGEPFTQQF